jgi:hypothetical protein
MRKLYLSIALLLITFIQSFSQIVTISNGNFLRVSDNTKLIVQNPSTNPFYEFSFFVTYTSTSTQRLITVLIKTYY